MNISFVLTTFLTISSATIVICQDTTVFAPLGATWYYTRPEEFPAINRYLSFVSEKDTFMLGYNARILGCYTIINDEIVRMNNLTKYISTVGNKVYYYVNGGFTLLYDFSALPGDTIQTRVEDFPIDMGCVADFNNNIIEFSYIVDSIDSLIIDGIKLRTQFIHVIDTFSGPTWEIESPIIERIGQIGFGGFWWGHGESCSLEGTGMIRCYQDIDLTFRSPFYDKNLPCDFTATNEIHSVNILNVFPNPSSNIISIPEEANNIIIYNITGAQMPFSIINKKIDISFFPPSYYLIICTMNGNIIESSFIKI